MPNSSFLEQFVEEARENVEELVAGLLRLETEGETEIEHTVKELFRYAHNLKGMAGAMGLEGTTELAHKMEDLLERYRQGGGRPSADEVDVLLAASDAVEAMIEEAASGGNPPAPPELVSLLVNHVAASLDKPTAGQAEKERPVPGELDAGHTALDVRLDENAQLLGARSAIVLRVIGEHGELVSTTPDRAALETGGVSSFVVVAQLADAEAAAAAVADVSDVVACAIVGCEQTSPKHAGVDRFEVQVDDAAQLPGARAAVVLQAFADRGTIESTNPDRQTIEAGKARTFVVELAGVEDAPVLASMIGSLTDVVACGLVKDAPQPGGAAKRDSEQRKGGSGQRVTVRVEVDRLDDLMDLVSELVVGRGLLEEQARRISDRSLGDALTSVQRTISDLQAMVAKVRMISLEQSFRRLTRIVRDTARDCDKQINFVSSGEDTELDRSMVEEVVDPLMHLLRNSVDHGIEAADDRIAAGKPAEGVVRLAAYHEGNQVIIEVSDDGGGVDTDRLCEKAVSNGLMTADEVAVMSDADKLELIFAAGLSTREAVSTISGRGVGADVVRTGVTKLGGTVTIESQRGVGSTFIVRLPLSLAVAETLLVNICDETWAIPIDQIEETLLIEPDEVHSVRGAPVIDLRGEVVPIVHGRVRLFEEPPAEGPMSAVVYRTKGRRAALTVDTLLGRSEVVVKPLPADLAAIDTASAVTILGDGSVGLILNVAALGDGRAQSLTHH